MNCPALNRELADELNGFSQFPWHWVPACILREYPKRYNPHVALIMYSRIGRKWLV